eukprot:jgi/Botrbrau1/5362/Bobra.0346s0032.1
MSLGQKMEGGHLRFRSTASCKASLRVLPGRGQDPWTLPVQETCPFRPLTPGTMPRPLLCPCPHPKPQPTDLSNNPTPPQTPSLQHHPTPSPSPRANSEANAITEFFPDPPSEAHRGPHGEDSPERPHPRASAQASHFLAAVDRDALGPPNQIKANSAVHRSGPGSQRCSTHADGLVPGPAALESTAGGTGAPGGSNQECGRCPGYGLDADPVPAGPVYGSLIAPTQGGEARDPQRIDLYSTQDVFQLGAVASPTAKAHKDPVEHGRENSGGGFRQLEASSASPTETGGGDGSTVREGGRISQPDLPSLGPRGQFSATNPETEAAQGVARSAGPFEVHRPQFAGTPREDGGNPPGVGSCPVSECEETLWSSACENGETLRTEAWGPVEMLWTEACGNSTDRSVGGPRGAECGKRARVRSPVGRSPGDSTGRGGCTELGTGVLICGIARQFQTEILSRGRRAHTGQPDAFCTCRSTCRVCVHERGTAWTENPPPTSRDRRMHCARRHWCADSFRRPALPRKWTRTWKAWLPCQSQANALTG